MKCEFMSQIRTKSDVIALISYIDDIVNSKYSDNLPKTVLPSSLNSFSSGLKDLSPSELLKFKKELLDLNSFVINLPFEPSTEFKDEIYNILSSYSGSSSFVIDVIVDMLMPLGFSLSLKGIYIENSLKDRIFNFLKTSNAI